MDNKEDGVWRTICGRKIFIKNGQSLSDAMRESGKFDKEDLQRRLRERLNKNQIIEDKDEIIKIIDKINTDDDEEFARIFYKDIKVKTIKEFNDNMYKINRGMEEEKDFDSLNNENIRYSKEGHSEYGRGIYFYNSEKISSEVNPYGLVKEYGVYKNQIYELQKNQRIDKIKNEVRQYYSKQDKQISSDRILMAMGYVGKTTGKNSEIILIYDKSNIYKKG